MNNWVKRLIEEEEGQGTTEYIIIVSLIAIACIGVYKVFGNQIKTFIENLGTKLEGATND